MKTFIMVLLITVVCYSQDFLFIEFSEAMDKKGLTDIENYELRFSPSSGMIVLSTYIYPVRIDSVGLTQFDNVVILFTTEHPDTNGVFQVRVFNVYDLAGNEINLEMNTGYY